MSGAHHHSVPAPHPPRPFRPATAWPATPWLLFLLLLTLCQFTPPASAASARPSTQVDPSPTSQDPDPHTGPSEAQLRAAFLLHFTTYVTWPETAFPSPEAPFVIGFLGPSPIADALQSLLQDRRIHHRPCRVVQWDTLPSSFHCHLLFIAPSHESTLPRSPSTTGILTVGESSAFADRGGIIAFTREGRKTRFEINLNAARQADLRLRSDLLRLARRVLPASPKD